MCDLLVALSPATDTHTLFAKNSDRPPDERQVFEVVRPRVEAVTRCTYIEIEPHPMPTLECLVSRPAWCWGAEHGVNEAGVVAGNASIYTVLDPRPFPDALIGMDLVRLVLERSETANAAAGLITVLLEKYGQGGSGHDPMLGRRPYWSSFLVADSGEAWVIESSGREWEAVRVDSTWALSNRTTIPAFDDRRHPRQPVGELVDPRLDATRNLLARRPVGVEAVMGHLASHGHDGWGVCMHVDGVQATTASMIVELPNGRRPVVSVAEGSPCVTPYRLIDW